MADIIRFNDRAKPQPRAFPETPRQRAGRRGNPLRLHAERISLAVIVAGKIANGRAAAPQGWGDDYVVALLRRAADSARFLANELDRVAAREEGEAPAPIA